MQTSTSEKRLDQLNGEAIQLYQDGAYDALKGMVERIRDSCKTLEEAIEFIEYTVDQMERMSVRRLGRKP